MSHSYTLLRLTAVLSALGTSMSALAQSNNAYFQDAGVIGSTNQISVTRLPVTANGSTYYFDVTLPFSVGASGELTIGTVNQVKSPNLDTAAFVPGTYVGPSTVLFGGALIVLTGPGVWDGKYTEWAISTGNGANGCTYPATAEFFVSPLTDNPDYARLKAANITSTAWYYGTGDGACEYGTWPGNGIIGVSQIGNSLEIASFTLNGTDQNTPVDTITYTLTTP